MRKTKKQSPYISDGLVEHLLNVFPDKSPRNRGVTTMDVGALIGRQEVIDHIKMLRAKQDDDANVKNL
jgi:hypothetical protein